MAQDLVALKTQLAAEAEKIAAQVPVSAATISTRGGILKLGDDAFPGNQVAVYVMDAVFENACYADDFNPDTPVPPVCYALSRERAALAPHEAMAEHPEYFAAQSETCAACPQNVYGSADRGRGKRCKNRLRLTLALAGLYEPVRGKRNEFELSLISDPAAIADMDLVMLRVPTTSVKLWAKYAQGLAAGLQLPPFVVATRVFLEADEKTQFKVCFEAVSPAPEEMWQALLDKHAAAESTPLVGYDPPDAAAPPKSSGALTGLRKP